LESLGCISILLHLPVRCQFSFSSQITTCIGSCIRLGIKLDSAKGCFQKRKPFQLSGSEPLDNGWKSLRYIVSYSISHGRCQLVIQPIIHISFARISLPTQLMCFDRSWESLCYQRSRSLAFQALQCFGGLTPPNPCQRRRLWRRWINGGRRWPSAAAPATIAGEDIVRGVGR